MSTISNSWRDNCSTITSALTHMLNNEIIVDATFKKDKVSCLFAHKLVLSIWSPKLADLIVETDKSQMFSITFDEDEDVLKMILQYLYCPDDINCFAKLTSEKLIQAIEFSEKYEIYHVYKKCLCCLRRKKISPSNVIDYFDYGLRKRFDGIVRKCIKVFETEGISIKLIREDFSATALLNLLSLDKIAMNSEAELLSLAVSWLSYPDNKCYKSDVLSFIDLQSINFTEYQDICKRYPNFLSDDELASIILSHLRQDPKLLPKWYKPRIRTTVEKECSLCMYIHKTMRISKPLQFIKINNRKDLKTVVQKFGFQFLQFTQVKVLNIELNFGPNEISPREFTLQFSLGRNVPVKKYSINTTKGNDKYKVFFESPLTVKSKDTLTLKFHFWRGLLANNIHVIWPTVEQHQEIHKTSDTNDYCIYSASSELAFYRSSDFSDKFIVSSFYLNVCENHCIFLNRKSTMESTKSTTENAMELDHKLSEDLCETIPFKTDVKKETFDVKKERADVKMEIDDEPQNYGSNVTLKDTKPFTKREIISLDSSTDEHYTPYKIVDHDEITHKVRIIKSEVIDLTYEQ